MQDRDVNAQAFPISLPRRGIRLVSSPASFTESLARATPLADGISLTVPEDWQQGRTAYGGFSTALALTAATRIGGEALPPLRSAQVSFVGPLFGEIEVRARLLRRGKNATWIAAEITREGQVGLAATFVFMGPVESALHLNSRPAPAGLIPINQALTFETTKAPVFMREHFDIRFAMPRDDEKRPEICWWVRAKEHAALDAMTGLMLVADALPPGVMPLLAAKSPVSSMTWQANLLTAAPATSDGWWLMRSAGDYAESGCSSQVMELWNALGEPVLAGMQSVALFG